MSQSYGVYMQQQMSNVEWQLIPFTVFMEKF